MHSVTFLLDSENLNLQMTKNFGVDILISLCVHTLLAQKFPHVGFEGQTLANHSYVDLSLVGDDLSGSDSVQCITNLSTCCSGTQGSHRGDWYFPNRTRLKFSGGGSIFESRNASRVDICRRKQHNLSGIYCCNISTSPVHVKEIVYVGLYSNSGGE